MLRDNMIRGLTRSSRKNVRCRQQWFGCQFSHIFLSSRTILSSRCFLVGFSRTAQCRACVLFPFWSRDGCLSWWISWRIVVRLLWVCLCSSRCLVCLLVSWGWLSVVWLFLFDHFQYSFQVSILSKILAPPPVVLYLWVSQWFSPCLFFWVPGQE